MEVEIKNRINAQHAWHYRILPDKYENGALTCLIDEKKDLNALQIELEVVLDSKVELVQKPSKVIEELLAQHYPENNGKKTKNLHRAKPEEILEILISESFSLGSSDIHIEPGESKSFVRYRKDGKLLEKYVLDEKVHLVVINKLKILSKLDISEKRLPQDGRLKLKIGTEEIDLRVSTLPTLHGEKAVLRLLQQSADRLNLNKIGMDDLSLAVFSRNLKRSQGLILISGPTGSGKTTTLYAGLKQINQRDSNVMTIEDPIEYTLGGLNQVQLKEGIGLTYPKALKSFLRQDPDIIMVGEIRDRDTANMVMRAALTGHLVLSTIHTNSAWETIERLEDLGIPRFSIASTLVLSLAQRLVRRLCESCKRERPLKTFSQEETSSLRDAPESLFEAVGCEKCMYTGYLGRSAIYEVVEVNKNTKEMIKTKVSEANVYSELGISSLKDRALEVLYRGESSFEEIYPYLLRE